MTVIPSKLGKPTIDRHLDNEYPQAPISIAVIGLGVAEHAELSSSATAALICADRIIGSQRQLDTIAHLLTASRGQYEGQGSPQLVVLPALTELLRDLRQSVDLKVVILASGDPLHYGIGRWLSRHFDPHCLHFYPAVSSIQMACHRCHLSLQDVQVVSLHGRPLEKIRRYLARSQYLVVLTDRSSQPHHLAEECRLAGFEQSQIIVCENLGYSSEQVSTWSVEDLLNRPRDFSDLHVSVIKVLGDSRYLPSSVGIADHHFITGEEPGKGMISKREVRLAILSMLEINGQHQVWDLGAGCGGVTVETAYWNAGARIHAVECHDHRLEYLKANCQRFGVSDTVSIYHGRALTIMPDLPDPDRIFIGGSDGELVDILDLGWQRLAANGILVASAVTETTQAQLIEFARQKIRDEYAVFEATAIQVSRRQLDAQGLPMGQSLSKLPVEIIQLKKCSEQTSL